MRLLALSGEASRCDDFDAAMGLWCFVGAEERIPEALLIDPFREPEARIEAGKNIVDLVHAKLPQVAEHLNKRHGVQYDLPFWQDAVVCWMMHLVHFSWRVYATVEGNVSKYQSHNVEMQIVEDGEGWSIPNTQAFASTASGNDDFRDWLISRCVEILAPKHWKLAAFPAPPRTEIDGSYGVDVQTLPVGPINGMRKWWKLLFSAVVMTNRKPIRERALPDCSADVSALFPEPYLGLLDRLLEQTIPTTFQEGFAELDSTARKRKTRPGGLRVCYTAFHDDPSNLALAYARLDGERIATVQHSGGYGWSEPHNFYAELEYRRDAFITWGWSKHGDYEGTFVPLATPRLNTYIDRHCEQDASMVFVGCVVNSLYSRIDPTPNTLDYLRQKITFMEGLSPALVDAIEYRPHMSPMDEVEFVRMTFPNLKVCEGDLEDRIMSCRLVVHDYASTPFCHSLVANTPTVIFFDPALWAVSHTAIPFFEDLKRAKILFDSPEEAALHINEVWDDIRGWWDRADVQAARLKWIREFAYTKKYWWLDWLRELRRL